MPSYNRVALIGNVTRDPETRNAGGTAVSEFALAVNEKRKDRSGAAVDEAMFIDVTCFGRLAEIATQYASKGNLVLVEGRLKLDQWEDRNSGGKRSMHKLIADRLVFLGGRNQSHDADEPQSRRHEPAAAGGRIAGQTQQQRNVPYEGDDDIPF